MVKRILFCLALLILVAGHAFAEEWTLLGRYAAKNDKLYVHTTDALILNHLFPYTSQTTDSHQLYDVYYSHDHEQDVRVVNEIVNLITVPIRARIIPLNIYGKPMISDGVFCGQIFSDVQIQNSGVFGVKPTAFSIVDSASQKTIFKMTGEMTDQVLLADSAAAKIVEITGPHKDWSRPIKGIPVEMIR